MLAIVYWRKSIYKGTHNIIHFNLCLSLLIGLVIFVSAIETAKDHETGCTAVAVLLHYFFLATFSWMLCEGIYLFVFLNFIFYTGYMTKWYIYFGMGWGLPVPIVAIAAGIANEHYGSERGCWLSEADGTIWAFVAPMLLIILVNCLFLVISLRIVYKNKKEKQQMHLHISSDKISHTEIGKAVLISAFTLIPILGVTWIFGLLAVNEETEVFAWIFTILNAFQGVFVFFFYVLKQEKVRQNVKAGDYIHRFSANLLYTLSRKSVSSSVSSDVLKVGSGSDTVRTGTTGLNTLKSIHDVGTISATKKIMPELSAVFNNADALEASDANTEHETAFNEESGLDENSDGSLNTASAYGYAGENSIEADLQLENKQY